MLDILARLTAIKHYAKDIHYNAKGEQFYAVHLLMDRVADGLDDFIDSINEVCYLGAGDVPPSSREVLRIAGAVIPVITEGGNIERLAGLIRETIRELDSVKDTDRADNSLLDSIAQDLKLKLGLLNRQVA